MDRVGAWGLGLARALVVVWVAGCTPLSQQSAVGAGDAGDAGHVDPDASADGGDEADGSPETPAGEPCDVEASMRCGGDGSASRQRDICQHGVWTPTAECDEGEVCTPGAAKSGASCLGVASICRGNAGVVVCDAEGVLYHCGSDGVIQSSESCPSVRSCSAGLAAMSCAVCVPGEFRCEADTLEHCDTSGMGFSKLETCAAGSCDAGGGRCRGAACGEKRSVCRADVLWTCDRGETDVHEVARCEPGLCDAGRGACNRCVPGLNSCDGETAVRCSADGAVQERVDCTADGSHCVGAGRCVRCARDSDCGAAGVCTRAYCNLAEGTCEPQPELAGTACPDGVCSATGTCVSCVTANDCPAVEDCQVRRCDAAGSCTPKPAAAGAACSGGGKCDGNGQCAACIADGDCPEPPACQVRHCDVASGACKPAPSPKGTKCEAGVCDSAGKCAGCNADSDCPAVGACQQKFCNPSTRVCEPKPAADGGRCNAAFGAGSCLSGRCVQCAADSACRTAGVCQEPFCRTSDNTCQQRPLANGVACAGGKVCDGAARCVECTSSLQCGDNATCVANACRCNAGYAKNATGTGCNFDDCAKLDDNRCGADPAIGNTCVNTSDGYDCTCAAPWKLGSDQCFQAGSGTTARTVKNGSSWNVVPDFAVVCDNAFDPNVPCPGGQLTWLNVCGLPDTTPATCSTIAGKTDTLAAVTLRRVTYAGALEEFGGSPGEGFTESVVLPAVGDVLLVQSLTALYVMRITALDAGGMTYDWAIVWRDTCWRPGGLTCSASCNCPGGN
jgi:hypothetical protein